MTKLLRHARKETPRLKARYQDLISVAVGFKHSREKGYGPQLQPSIKLLVHRKLRKLSRRQRLPRRVSTQTRGRRSYLPTDVEELGRLRLHIRPIAAGAPPTVGAPGTPGFILQAGDGRGFLITAGHVLQDLQPRNPWNPPDAPVGLGGPMIGRIDPPNTYYHSAGLLYDVGVVELRGNTALSLLQEKPWANLKSVADLATLREWFYSKTTKTFCRLYGWQTQPYAVLDTLNESVLPVPVLGENYAPVMIMSRAQDAPFLPGDSGAPLVYDEEVLVGLHVLGTQHDPAVGWSISAYTLIRSLERQLGTNLNLWRGA